MTKAVALACLQELPDSFEPEQLIKLLLAFGRLEKGSEQIPLGEAETEEEITSRLAFVTHLRKRIAESDHDKGVSLEEARRRLMPPAPDAT